MGWVSLLTALLKIGGLIAGYLKDKQLMDAGKAKAIVEGMEHVSAMVDDAGKGADGMQFDTDWSRRVRDKYRRKD
ncbi:MAG: hypothetical protein L0Y56_10145 [Nitrospira sp.]|nr:hypothetical protein [Nitrospira sp.]